MKLNGLDLFSGIGGISLALEPWVRTIAYCEQDRCAQGVLVSRMRDGSLDRAPIWPDVRTLSAEQFESSVDLIFGGFPCQDISVAGNGKGLAGERSGLFFEITRLAQELKPSFIFLENVPAIRTRGLVEVVRTLTDLGYDCRWTCLSAADVGAPHLRKRWFLLAHADRKRGGNQRQDKVFNYAEMDQRPAKSRNDGEKEPVANNEGDRRSKGRSKSEGQQRRPNSSVGRCMANADGIGLEESKFGCEPNDSRRTDSTSSAGWWATEPDVDRVVNGLPYRVDRIRCLGNAVVPMQAREAFQKLIGI